MQNIHRQALQKGLMYLILYFYKDVYFVHLLSIY